MAKHTFAGKGEEPTTESTKKETTAVTKQNTEVAKSSAGSFDGAEDLPTSRITVYHPMSQYEVDGVTAGDLVLDKEVIIGSSARLTVLSVLRRWKELISFDDDDSGDARIANTPEERDELIDELGAKGVIPFVDFLVLVERPDDVDAELFPYTLDGKDYSLAKFTTQKKGNVAETYGRVRTARTQHKLEDCVFELTTKARQWEKYRWNAPVMSRLRDVSPPKGAHELLEQLMADD